MFSRLAFRSATKLLPATVQGSHVKAASSTVAMDYSKRLENIPPVRMGFIPDSWFTLFYSKTGVTGPYMFMVSLSTYLVSKEIYVLEHEYYNGLTFLLIWVVGINKYGDVVREFIHKDRSEVLKTYDDSKAAIINQFESTIEHEQRNQTSTQAHKLIMDVKRENIKMQLEAVYRERLAEIYSNVKKRLDYQVQVQHVERRIAQKHMAQWIISNVLKAITPEQEKATLQQCVKDLHGLAKA